MTATFATPGIPTNDPRRISPRSTELGSSLCGAAPFIPLSRPPPRCRLSFYVLSPFAMPTVSMPITKAWRDWEMSQKSWESFVSSIAIDAARGLRRLAEPAPENDRIKTAIGRAARRAGLSYWRAFDLWYGKARRIDAVEFAAIKAAERTKQNEARNDLLALAADFSALAERASLMDPEMVGPWADAMRDIAGRARSLADE